MRSLAVSFWGIEEGGDLGEAKAEEPAWCNSNGVQETQPPGLLVYVLVTFRDYLARLNNVTIEIYVGAHLLSLGELEVTFPGESSQHLGLLLPCETKLESLGL